MIQISPYSGNIILLLLIGHSLFKIYKEIGFNKENRMKAVNIKGQKIKLQEGSKLIPERKKNVLVLLMLAQLCIFFLILFEFLHGTVYGPSISTFSFILLEVVMYKIHKEII